MLQSIFKLFRRDPINGVAAEPAAQTDKPVVKLDTATGLMVERYYHHGKLHRDGDQPAVIEYEPSSKRVLREQYFLQGQLHRTEGKPAFIEYSASTGNVVLEVFFQHGKLYRNQNSPAAIDYDRSTGAPILYDQSRPGSPPIKQS